LADLMEITPGSWIVDLGCGTGYLGIMASLLGAGLVIAVDLNASAVRWTVHNAHLNNVENLVAYQGTELDAIAHLDVDQIVTLPPQMPFFRNFNPWRYGGRDGCDVLIHLIEQARLMLLRKKGILLLLHSGLAYPTKVRAHLMRCGFTCSTLRTVDRKLDPDECDQLCPGLCDYLLQLGRDGIAEITKRTDGWYYPVWFYRAVLSESLHETYDSCDSRYSRMGTGTDRR
ncbi:MAG TPA: 50S ribosomal protein L11 methyltransferase, partial [Thermodesulfobacteriota bacterium]|nr:50S ribosomal protein L11 methyltransferase [Thermodesulfobacteriota bacterium]